MKKNENKDECDDKEEEVKEGEGQNKEQDGSKDENEDGCRDIEILLEDDVKDYKKWKYETEKELEKEKKRKETKGRGNQPKKQHIEKAYKPKKRSQENPIDLHHSSPEDSDVILI